MCGIWDWQSTIVKYLKDSHDPKHTLFCRENVFVTIYALLSDKKCHLCAYLYSLWLNLLDPGLAIHDSEGSQ